MPSINSYQFDEGKWGFRFEQKSTMIFKNPTTLDFENLMFINKARLSLNTRN